MGHQHLSRTHAIRICIVMIAIYVFGLTVAPLSFAMVGDESELEKNRVSAAKKIDQERKDAVQDCMDAFSKLAVSKQPPVPRYRITSGQIRAARAHAHQNRERPEQESDSGAGNNENSEENKQLLQAFDRYVREVADLLVGEAGRIRIAQQLLSEEVRLLVPLFNAGISAQEAATILLKIRAHASSERQEKTDRTTRDSTAGGDAGLGAYSGFDKAVADKLEAKNLTAGERIILDAIYRDALNKAAAAIRGTRFISGSTSTERSKDE